MALLDIGGDSAGDEVLIVLELVLIVLELVGIS